MKKDEILNVLYPVPDLYASVEAFEKYTHSDLHEMSKPEIMKERHRIKFILTFADDPDDWLIERFGVIKEVLHERQVG